jgi:hypothetical protein
MIVVVDQYDNDYNAFCGSLYIKADQKQAVIDWCKDNSWSGHHYVINCELHHNLSDNNINYDLTGI